MPQGDVIGADIENIRGTGSLQRLAHRVGGRQCAARAIGGHDILEGLAGGAIRWSVVPATM